MVEDLFIDGISLEEFDNIYDEVLDKKRNCWLLSPGEGGNMINQFVKAGVAAIDWFTYDFGDLMRFSDRESIQEYMCELDDEEYKLDVNSLALYQFSHEIKIGDIIVCKGGIKSLIAIGIAISGYYHVQNNDLIEYNDKNEIVANNRHRINVRWISDQSISMAL